MPELHYRDALKRGQRETRACAATGEYPYLPVLDDFVPSERVTSGIDLGIQSIPAEFIVGTKTRGRTNAFARNFMPILPENSEFAQKWERLCKSHLAEGIRDPIRAYEYMNRYYVEEGNKRVSVLRFFDAVNIPAHVIRVMPEALDAPEAELYREYLAFNRVSGVNFIEFSRRGSYERLQERMGKAADAPWSDEERARFSSAYFAFKSAYEAAGGGKLSSTVGDALLSFVEIYGYDALCASGAADLKKAIARMWEEVRLQQEDSPIELKPVPADGKREGLISKVLAAKPIQVAFIYDRSPESSAWAFGHDQGRLHAQAALNGRIETRAYCDAMKIDARQVIEQAVGDGCRVVFTTSPRLLQPSLQAAVAHPEVTILNCSLNQSHRYIRTYYARIYEAKLVVGAIAGAMAGDGDVGYVCDYPIYGQIAGINAFALGVQMVNPRAKVVLEWSSVVGQRAARRKLNDRGIRLISSQDFSRQADGGFGPDGLTLTGDGAPRLLAAPLWKWDVYYEEILRRILDKTLRDEYQNSVKALNYYWGMAAGVVDAQWSEDLPSGVRKLAAFVRRGVVGGELSPFAQPLFRQDGGVVEMDGQALGLEEIMNMDYLVENIEGAIPSYDELKAFSRATVEVMGVAPSTSKARPGEGGAPV